VFYNSSLPNHITVTISDYLYNISALTEGILREKGWRMINAFDPSAAFTYDSACQNNGIHIFALMLSAMRELAKVENQCIDSWLIVECQDGTIELRTTDGRLLQQDGQGGCKLLPIHSQSSSYNFQLLRVSDKLDKVLWNRDGEYSTTMRQQHDQNFGKEKELWMLRSPSHGTFLGLTLDNNLIISSEASFWQVDENFCLTHTSDSPARRQHYRRMWKTQSVAYVETMRKKHLAFALGTMTIEMALDLTQHLLANLFFRVGHGGNVP